MKNSIYESAEKQQEIIEKQKKDILKEISDLKNLRKQKADELSKKAINSDLRWINKEKDRIKGLTKQIREKEKRYYLLCTPSLF